MRRVCLLLSILVAGCDGAGGGLPPPPDGPYGEVISRMCDVLDRCPDGLGRPLTYRSHAECVAIADWAVSCELTERELPGDVTVYGVARRMLEIDEAQAEECLAWLEMASCEDIAAGGDTPCSSVFTAPDDEEDGPTLAGLDEACESDDECEPELFCFGGDVDMTTGVQTCRVCRPRLGEGEDCSAARCQPGLYCKADDPANPTTIVCAQPEPDDTRCYADEQCASGFCNTTLDDLGGWGRCDPGGHEGEPCDERFDCRANLMCDGTCQPLRENGEACTDASQCTLGVCDASDGRCGAADGASCSYPQECRSGGCVDAVCGPPPPDAECYGDETCPESQVCSFDSNRCVDPQADGSSCDRDEECASGFCNFEEQCQTQPELGDPCTSTYECDPRAYCREGRCIERLQPGERCDALDSCLEPFVCRNGACELINLVCEPAHAGEMCAMFRVCDESSYCDLIDGITCKPRAAEGEACSPSPIRGVEVCAAGLACANDAMGELRCQRRAAIGAPCDDVGCVEDATCTGGTCVENVLGPACDYDTPCPSAMFCDDDLEQCVPRRAEGGECDGSDECDDATFCDARTCVARHGADEECYDQRDCRPELHCQGYSTCQPDLPEGSPCDSRDAPCEAGTYCPSGIDGVCTRQGAGGAPCSSNEECMSGVCYGYDICLASPECVAP